MNTRHLLTVALAALLTLTATAREWTSKDGRKISAAYLGRAPDGVSLVLLRDDTASRITVPLAALSDDDQAYAATLPRVAAPAAAEVPAKPTGVAGRLSAEGVALLASLPEMPTQLGQLYFTPGHNDCVQFADRYRRAFAGLDTPDAATSIRYLRIQIERDLKELTPIAGSTATKSALNARCNLYWLQTKLVPHLAKIEAQVVK